jgi:uncharacterized protein (TIGR02266 family)
MMIDRRHAAAARVPLRLPVVLQPRDAFTVVRGATSNLSRGGLFLESQEQFEPGEELSVLIDPGDGDRPLDLRARVAWARPTDATGGKAGMALRFTDHGDPAQAARLDRALARAQPTSAAPLEVIELDSIEELCLDDLLDDGERRDSGSWLIDPSESAALLGAGSVDAAVDAAVDACWIDLLDG